MGTLELIPHLPQLTGGELERWIGAALAEAAALRQHDARLFPLTDDAAAMDTARALREAWRQWAGAAEALLRRAAPSAADAGAATSGAAPARLEELRLGIAYARGLSQMPAEEVLARHARVQSGHAKLYTTEEARRELGLAPRG